MAKTLNQYLVEYPLESQNRYHQVKDLINSIEPDITPYMWGGVPTFQRGNHYVRIIVFKDHLNINTSIGISVKELNPTYIITPKGMVQIFHHESLDIDWLKTLFQTVYYKDEVL